MVWIHRIIVAYVVATTMHVPFPVFDGDNLRSGETHSATAKSTTDAYDVDFILLGCDPPDDSDDGPVDDDPEDGSTSIFGPLYSTLKTGCQSLFSVTSDHNEIVWSSHRNNDHLRAYAWQFEFVFRQFSFGKLCQSGTAHKRC